MTWQRRWKLEYTVTLFVFAGVLLALAPVSFENTRQANFISKWNEIYNKTDYMFQVINAQITEDVLSDFKNAETSAQRERLLVDTVKPYLRLNTVKNVPRRYRTKYMNKARVYKGQQYHFSDLHFTEDNRIVGIKDLPPDGERNPIFIMMFDINGFLPPNTWGRDVFGINVFEGGRIEPFGQGLDMSKLHSDCSETGTGVFCSYYYKIGGGFTE